jgi:hypothetical protein
VRSPHHPILSTFSTVAGLFIYNNYKQAINTLHESERTLTRLEQLGVVRHDEFAGYLEEERQYLRSLEKEPPKETMEMEYIEILMKLNESEYVNVHNPPFFRIIQSLISHARDLIQKMKQRVDTCSLAKKQQHRALTRVWRNHLDIHLKWTHHVQQFEAMHDIEERWKECDDKWIAALTHLQTRRYRRSLDDLSRLLIQRLFELEKLGIGGTGGSP